MCNGSHSHWSNVLVSCRFSFLFLISFVLFLVFVDPTASRRLNFTLPTNLSTHLRKFLFLSFFNSFSSSLSPNISRGVCHSSVDINTLVMLVNFFDRFFVRFAFLRTTTMTMKVLLIVLSSLVRK